MFGRDRISDRFFDLPPGLSEQEKNELLERARYDTFTQPKLVGRVTLFDWATVITLFLCASGLSWLLLEFTPLGKAGLIVQSLITALSIALAIFVSQLAIQRNRARLMNPRIRELSQLDEVPRREKE